MKTKSLWIALCSSAVVGLPTASVKSAEPQAVALASANDLAPEMKVLDQFVGTWNDEVTIKPTERNPQETKTTGTTIAERVLNGRFVQWKTRRQPGNQELMQIATYDPQRKEYRSWFFSSLSNGDEWTGQWNEDSKTFSGKANLPSGFTGTRETRFADKDTLEWTVVSKDQSGKVVFDLQGKSTRQKDGERPKDETIEHPLANPAELKVLDRLVGTWDWEDTLKPAEWTPQEVRLTGTLTRKWVLGGRFLEERGGTAENPNICMFTYDARQQAYRFWIFEAQDNITMLTGQWDQAASTMTWSADLGNGITSAGPMHFIDDDTQQWSAVAKDTSGKVYLDMGGKVKRKR